MKINNTDSLLLYHQLKSKELLIRVQDAKKMIKKCGKGHNTLSNLDKYVRENLPNWDGHISSNRNTTLENLPTYMESKESTPSILYNLVSIESYIEDFEELVCEYCKSVGKIVSLPLKAVKSKSEEVKYKLTSNIVFNVYFYYVPTKPKNSHAVLAKGVLKLFKDAEPVFENIQSEKSITYSKGNISMTRNSTCVVNLISPQNDRSVHIKFYCADINKCNQIHLGSYITFKQDRIVRGSIVLEPITNSIEIVNARPAVLSYHISKEEFTNVNESIRKYLTLKKHNYNRVATEINTYDDLAVFLEGKYKEEPNHRFIEQARPIVYISFPNSSLRYKSQFKKISSILDNIKTDFISKYGDIVEFKYQQDWHKDKDLAGQPSSLKYLPMTSMFVLIYPFDDIKSNSFSFVELGLALNKCKRILLLYNPKVVSSNMKRVYDVGDHIKRTYIYNLNKKEGAKTIKDEIMALVKSSIATL